MSTPFSFDDASKPDSTAPAAQKSPNRFSFDEAAGNSGGFLSDVGKSLKSGVEQLPGIVTGILDLPSAIATGARPFSKAADAVGEATGFQPGQWAKATQYSQGYQQGQQAIDQAWKDGSAGDIALSYLKNPGYTANQVVQSVPSMLLGGVASKAALGVGRIAGIAGDAAEGIAARAAVPGALERAVGEKLAVPVAAGAGEGAVTAGQQMDQYEGPDQQKNALASLAAGVGTAALGGIAGRVANKLGLETAETAIAKAGTGASRAADEVPLSAKRRILGGIVSESVLQELPQSAQEQMWQNYADGKPIMDGVVRQGIEGALAGGVMGGVANVRGEGAAHGATEGQAPAADQPNASEPLALPAPTITVAPNGTAATAADRNNILQRGAEGDITDVTPVAKQPPLAAPLALPAPVINVGADNVATTAADRNALLNGAQPEAPIERRPSEAMGLDATAGPLSAAAVTAVDSGAHQSLKDATAQAQAADSTAMLQSQGTGSKEAVTAPDGSSAPQADQAGLDPTVFPTYEQADAFRKEQMARGGSISALPVPADGGFRLATKGSAGYSEGELLRQDRMAQQQRADAGILDGDILKKSGEPFSNRVQARNAANKAGPGHEIAPVKGGFVVRPVSQDLAAQAQATVQSVAEKSAVSAAQAPAQAVAAAPAIPQPNAVQQALANIREQKTQQQDQTHVADTAAPAEAGQVPAAAPQAQTDQAGNAADGRPSVSAEGVSAAGSAAVEGNGVAAPAAQAPEFTTTKDIGGHSVTVRTADLQSDKPKLRMFTQDGKPRAGSIHRDNLDPTGEKLAANAAENAANPLFNTITNKSGGAFATAPAAQRQLNRMGLGATHEVLPAGNGFVVRKKVKATPAIPAAKTARGVAAKAQAANQARQEYFTPGNIVTSYGGHDRVVSYDPGADGKPWSVTVHAVEKQGNQWADVPNERDRTHSTQPDARTISAGPVERASASSSSTETPAESVLASAAHEAATSPKNELPEPTDAQKEAGNYQKGHVRVNGLDISIENPAGSKRRPEWPALKHHYGYIKGTIGRDKDHVDVFLTNRADDSSLPVFVVDQNNRDGSFDEHKVILGATDEVDARKTYLSNYSKGWTGIGGITRMSQEEFKAWVRDPKKTRARTAPADSAPSKASASIEDSGAVLEGARKMYAANYATKMQEGEALDIATAPLSKSWPEPDYQRLIDEGADPHAVAFMRAARDEVPNKPVASWKVKAWAQKVQILRDFASRAIAEEELGNLVADRLKDFPSLKQIQHKMDLYEAVGHGMSLKGMKLSEGRYGVYGREVYASPRTIWTVNKPTKSFGGWGVDVAFGSTKAEAIEKFKEWHAAQDSSEAQAAKQTSFDIYTYRSKPNEVTVGKRISASKSIDLKTFATVKEARAYIADNQAELERMLADAKVEPSERRESNAPRVGDDHRNGADVTTEQFREAFGFRGEQFGATMPQSERQANLNQTYDALMDLAGVIGVPPRALSLNGELGIAFGARGKGGKNPAAAHYERDVTGAVTANRVVINLTRKNGAGSLAHEWFHAVDNYFARMRGMKSGMLTESYLQPGQGVRPEMIAAFRDLMSTINRTGLKERSKKLDAKRTKDYWSTGLEMAARSFESYVIAKLQDHNKSNDYLANVVNEALYALQGAYPYLSAGEIPSVRAAFDNFFQTVQTKETEQGVAMFSRSPMKSVEANVSRGRESLSRALADRTSVHRAMFRNGLGWVDFVWGAPGRVTPSGKTRGAMGLAHIAEARRRKDRMSEAEIARTLDGIVNAIARGTETRRHTQGSTVQVAVEKDGIEAILTRRAGSNAWLLTGYETKSPGVSEAGNVALTTTADGSTTTRPAVVAGDSGSIARPAPEGKSASSDAALSVEKGPAQKISTQDSNEQLIATQALVDELKANWSRAPDVVVARNMDDPHIPDDVRALDQQMRDQGGDGSVKGFLARGTVYLLSDNLSSPQQIAETLFHEALGHYGLRRAFGASLKPILQQIVTMRRTQVIDKARAYGLFDKDQLQGLTAKTASDFHIWSAMSPEQRLTAAEEVLAEMAETSPTIGFVTRAIAAIRTWLRETIPALKNLELTDAEIIRSYITPAREFVTRQNESVSAAVGRAMGTVFPGVAFQRGAGDQIETPEFKRWFGESKVVDAEGKPQVVYHGTNKTFDVFDADAARSIQTDATAQGFYLTRYPEDASGYATGRSGRDGANILPVFVSLQNPYVWPSDDLPPTRITAAKRAELESQGHDGIIYRDGEEVVAFRPEQIKSATGNNGQFDPGNPDIRFSRTTTAGVAARMGDAIKSVNVQNIKDKAGYKKTDWLGLGLQTLGRRQIVEIYGKDLPQLNEYNKLAAQMEADKNEVGAEADQLAQRWGKLKDEKQLADLMHDATLAQIDAAEPYVAGDDQAQHMILSRRFQALTNEAQQVYLDARNAYGDHHSKVREAIKQRIMRSELTGPRRAELLKRMDDEFFKKTKGVYFPLARFGQYVVSVRGPNGAIASVNRAETMAEAQALHASLSKAYPAKSGFEVVRPVLSKEFIASRDAVGRGFMTNLFSALENVDMGANERMELEDTLGQLYLSSLPDLSWAKHGIHRKGTPGFSQDARRAFAQNMFHGGRYLAKLRYADRMQSAITDMQKTADDLKEVEDFDQPTAQRVIDEMQKRHEALMNPKSNSLSSSITSFGFVFFLGMSPASALVNLSQTALVAYPVMGAKWGFDKSGAALLRASKEAAKGKNDITGFLTPEERGAYDEAVRSGTIDVTQAHDLTSIAQGEDSGVMWKIRPVMRWASFMFHHAERFNRQVTFIAAYRLAREAGADKASAYEQATDATYKGHFDYSSGNRPRVMQGNTAKVLLLFKQFGQNMIYTMARNAQQSINGETPEARREARRALAGLLVMHGLGAGTLGLPMVTTLLAAASMLGGGGGDEPWDAKVALQNLLADTFGQKAAEVLMHGVSRLTPWDISGRVGLDSLILPDVQEGLEGQRLAESAMAGALGPAAGIGINVLKGLQDMSNGEYARGLEGMMPAVLRNVMKSVRYAKEGAQDKSGVVIKDEVSPAGVIGQALGFSPSDVRNASEGRSAVIALDSALNRRRSQLLNEFANARRKGDAEDVSAAQVDIAQFNEKNPDRRITVPQMMQSVRARQRRIDQAKDGVYLPKSHRDAAQAGRFAVTG